MLFAATQMNLEMLILSQLDRERQISCNIAYMWNLKKKGGSEFIYKVETDSQT